MSEALLWIVVHSLVITSLIGSGASREWLGKFFVALNLMMIGRWLTIGLGCV